MQLQENQGDAKAQSLKRIASTDVTSIPPKKHKLQPSIFNEPTDGEKLLCRLCNIMFNSHSQADMHYKGKRHKHAVDLKNVQNVSKVLSPALLQEDSINGSSFVSGFHCDICNVSLNSVEQHKQHCNGIKHKLEAGIIKEPPQWWLDESRRHTPKRRRGYRTYGSLDESFVKSDSANFDFDSKETRDQTGAARYAKENDFPLSNFVSRVNITETFEPSNFHLSNLMTSIPNSQPLGLMTRIPHSQPLDLMTSIPHSQPLDLMTSISHSQPLDLMTSIPHSQPLDLMTSIPHSQPPDLMTNVRGIIPLPPDCNNMLVMPSPPFTSLYG